MTPSGNFKAMQKYLYSKAYSLRTAINGCRWMSVNTQLKLFDLIIKPILLYRSGVWGAYIYKHKNTKGSLDCILENVAILFEKVHSKVCKYILQVNKRASNFTVRSELGRFPLVINIISRMFNYYVICSLVDTAVDIYKSTEVKQSWYCF